MTRPQDESTIVRAALELLSENGLAEMAGAIEILIYEAMKLERSEFLGAAPYERNENRRGHANGFKAKSLATRLGRLCGFRKVWQPDSGKSGSVSGSW